MKAQPLSGQIGRFHFSELIGAGTSSEVYRVTAEDGKEYALKLLYPGFDFQKDPQLENEIKALRHVNHPNVVRFLGAGEITVSGVKRFYLQMEFIPGQTLREWFSAHTHPSEDEWVPVAYALAEAVRALHKSGIIHRDLKPENIKISANGEVKLLDLGLARIQDASMSMSIRNNFTGTLLYASPEQLSGKPVRKSSDLYSLGVVLYEMVCGAHPFHQEGDDLPKLVTRILGKTPRSLRALGVETKPRLELLILQLLAKNAQDRPVDMDDVIACLKGKPLPKRKNLRILRRVLPVAAFIILAALAVFFFISRPPVIPVEEFTLLSKALGYDEMPWDYVHCMEIKEIEKKITLSFKDKYFKVTYYNYYMFSTSDGKYHKVVSGKGHAYVTDISLNNEKLILAKGVDGQLDLFVLDIKTGKSVNVTNQTSTEGCGVFSPGMNRIAFDSDRDGLPGVYVMDIDGANPERVVPMDAACFRPSWLPDGNQLVFERLLEGHRDIWMVDLNTGELSNLTNTQDLEEWSPIASIDGLVVCAVEPNDETRRYLNIINPDTGASTQVPSVGYAIWSASWTPDGKWIIPSLVGKVNKPWADPDNDDGKIEKRIFYNFETGEIVSIEANPPWEKFMAFR